MNTSNVFVKGWFVVILGMVLGVLMMPTADAATYSGGSGILGDPYLISSSADLLTLSGTSADWASHFLMTNDIDMTGESTFTPIGNNTTKFTGVFDGGGHVIQNLVIDLPAQDYVGVFGHVFGASAEIKNLGIQGGSVSGKSYTGGLVGENKGILARCFSTSNVTGDYVVGGLVGINNGNITCCYATGSVAGIQTIGGLVGNSSGIGEIVTACYATGLVSGIQVLGGLAGSMDEGLANLSFWDMESTGQNNSAVGKGLTSTQMTQVSIFQNADWSAYDWVMTEGQRPRLTWEGTGDPLIPIADTIPLGGNGTFVNPYIVNTTEEFALLSWYSGVLDSHILLLNSIDLKDVTVYPIGDLGQFVGVFDGANNTLSNIHIRYSMNNFVGVFSRVGASGEISNLGIINADIEGNRNVGCLIGENCGTVTNCYTSVNIYGMNHVGGLVGYNKGGVISSCYSMGLVRSITYAGGLVGGNEGTITSCYAISSVLADIETGGLVGDNRLSGTLINCYSTGAVVGYDRVGGLVGNNDSLITSCYTTGSVFGNTNLGGLVGSLVGSPTITSSFWDKNTGGPDNGIGTGLPTSQMKQQTSFESAGWDFTGPPPVWIMYVEGLTYPHLYGLSMPITSIESLQSLAYITSEGSFFLTWALPTTQIALR